MDRREPRVRNFPLVAVPCPSSGGAYPVLSETSPLWAEGQFSYRSERSDSRPDSRPKSRIKKLHTGLTE
jgi:hypothetical protein